MHKTICCCDLPIFGRDLVSLGGSNKLPLDISESVNTSLSDSGNDSLETPLEPNNEKLGSTKKRVASAISRRSSSRPFCQPHNMVKRKKIRSGVGPHHYSRFRADLQFLDELERWKIERMENPQPLPCTVLYCTIVELDRKESFTIFPKTFLRIGSY